MPGRGGFGVGGGGMVGGCDGGTGIGPDGVGGSDGIGGMIGGRGISAADPDAVNLVVLITPPASSGGCTGYR